MKTEMKAMKTGMNWRLASRLSVITLAILVVIVVTLIQQHNAAKVSNGSGLQGTDLGELLHPIFG